MVIIILVAHEKWVLSASGTVIPATSGRLTRNLDVLLNVWQSRVDHAVTRNVDRLLLEGRQVDTLQVLLVRLDDYVHTLFDLTRQDVMLNSPARL